MTLEKLRRALARQQSIRRARDLALILFAVFLSAAIFLWALVLVTLRAAPRDLSPLLLVYAATGFLAAFFAARLFGSARVLGRRLLEAREPGALLDESASNPAEAVWAAFVPWPRRKD